MTEPLSAQYDPAQIEAALYREWEERGYFHARAERVLNDGADPYVIVSPPPNVTAVLHLGHGLNNTIQDVLIRWRRMQGRESLYLPGTDHAGIATQNVVERQLAAEGLTRDDVGREACCPAVYIPRGPPSDGSGAVPSAMSRCVTSSSRLMRLTVSSGRSGSVAGDCRLRPVPTRTPYHCRSRREDSPRARRRRFVAR
jgi:hypothetical protein